MSSFFLSVYVSPVVYRISYLFLLLFESLFYFVLDLGHHKEWQPLSEIMPRELVGLVVARVQQQDRNRIWLLDNAKVEMESLFVISLLKITNTHPNKG